MTVTQSSLQGPLLRVSDERAHLFLVADGMGGHQAGEHASALAIAAIEQFTLDSFKWFLQDEPGSETAAAEFETAMKEADAAILREAGKRPELEGMGTTLTLGYVVGRHLFVLHVGDSRAYLHHDGALTQITQDHTVVAEMIRRGQLRPEEAATHRLRHVITNVLGGGAPGIRAEAHIVEIEAGDRLLLCSDGLTEVVSADEIGQVIGATDEPEAATTRLVNMANERGGPDNITAVVAYFTDSAEPKA